MGSIIKVNCLIRKITRAKRKRYINVKENQVMEALKEKDMAETKLVLFIYQLQGMILNGKVKTRGLSSLSLSLPVSYINKST